MRRILIGLPIAMLFGVIGGMYYFYFVVPSRYKFLADAGFASHYGKKYKFTFLILL